MSIIDIAEASQFHDVTFIHLQYNCVLSTNIILNKIHSFLSNKNLVKDKKTLFQISGLGGIGKTTLLKIVPSIWQDIKKSSIRKDDVTYLYLYFDYKKDINYTIQNTLTQANIQKEFEYQEYLKWLCDEVHAFLCVNKNSKVIIAIDNYCNRNNDIENLLSINQCYVIISTRDVSRIEYCYDYVNIESLDLNSSIDLFCLYFYENHEFHVNDETRRICESFVKMTGYNALMIELLARFANKKYLENRIDLVELHEYLTKNGFSEISRQEYYDDKILTDKLYADVVRRVIQLYNVSDLSDAQKNVMYNFALLPDNSQIFYDNILSCWLKNRSVEIEELSKLAWIKIVPGFSCRNDYIIVHKMIKEIYTLPSIKNESRDISFEVYRELINALTIDYSDIENTKYFSYSESIMNNLREVFEWDYLAMLAKNIQYFIDTDSYDQPALVTKIACNCLDTLYSPEVGFEKSLLAVEVYNNVGYYYAGGKASCDDIVERVENAFIFLSKALVLLEKINEPLETNKKQRLLQRRAIIYSNWGAASRKCGKINYQKYIHRGISLYNDAKIIREELMSMGYPNHGLQNSYRTLGVAQFELRNFHKSIEYHSKCFDILIEKEVERSKLQLHLSKLAISLNYKGGSIYESAKDNFNRSELVEALKYLLTARFFYQPYCNDCVYKNLKCKNRNTSKYIKQLNDFYMLESRFIQTLKSLYLSFFDSLVLDKKEDVIILYTIYLCPENRYLNTHQFFLNDIKLKEIVKLLWELDLNE